MIGIVILNWRNVTDTVECIGSVLQSNYRPLRIVVCDNHSCDGSIEVIATFLRGLLEPRNWVSLKFSNDCFDNTGVQVTGSELVTIIEIDRNLGFAGGNNVGLAYLMEAGTPPEYFWLLNNDTIVDPNAAALLVRRMKDDPQIGICGARLVYADSPQVLQAHGGAAHNRWLGIGKYIGHLAPASEFIDTDTVESSLDYVCGASMFVSAAFIQKVGLMAEHYFLFFEELDWSVRGRKYFRLGYASEAKVFHKEGATIGSSSDTRRTSWLCDHYLFLNRIRFTKAYYPYALPTVYLAMLLQAARRLLRGQQDRAWLILCLLVGWRWRGSLATSRRSNPAS